MNEIAATQSVRKAQPQEAMILAELIQALALESEGRTLDAATLQAGIRAVFENPARGTYWALTQGERLIGCLLITTEWSDWNNAPYWWIQSVYIRPEFRGQGGFERMLQTVEQAAHAENAAELRLYVEKDNQRAMRVYARNGFESEHYRCMTKNLVE